jgi:hypothetical protein
MVPQIEPRSKHTSSMATSTYTNRVIRKHKKVEYQAALTPSNADCETRTEPTGSPQTFARPAANQGWVLMKIVPSHRCVRNAKKNKWVRMNEWRNRGSMPFVCNPLWVFFMFILLLSTNQKGVACEKTNRNEKSHTERS